MCFNNHSVYIELEELCTYITKRYSNKLEKSKHRKNIQKILLRVHDNI